MTTDWRPYELLTKEDWRQGDEPEIRLAVTVEYRGSKIIIPLPDDASVSISQNAVIDVSDPEPEDPNYNKYTCAPYGVPKCPSCLRPEEDCDYFPEKH